MPRYMDDDGFQKKDWKDAPRQIRRAMRWLQELLDRGATVPEAMWDVLCTFEVAAENLRYARVQRKAKVPKRSRSSPNLSKGPTSRQVARARRRR